MRFRRYFLLVLLFFLGCNISKKQEISQIEEITRCQKPYYISAPISKLSSTLAPCLDVSIENKCFSMELDLGFRGNLTFPKKYVDDLSSKAFLREKPMYGIRGKEYIAKLYQIPSLGIGKMTFLRPILQEEDEIFSEDATFVQGEKERSPREPGRLGWELFFKVNLFIDVQNSLIAFCDSLETLGKQGYEIGQFTCVPLFLERGLVELEAKIPKGILRCVLDTGSTWNLQNCGAEEEQSIDDLMWVADSVIEYDTFKIDGKNFGSTVFHKVPIKIPIQIDAILGMEFFEKNMVFLDFVNGCAYISKSQNFAPCLDSKRMNSR